MSKYPKRYIFLFVQVRPNVVEQTNGYDYENKSKRFEWRAVRRAHPSQ